MPVNKFLELIFIVQLLTTAVAGTVMPIAWGGGQNLMMGNMSLSMCIVN